MKEPTFIMKDHSKNSNVPSIHQSNYQKQVFSFCIKTVSPVHIGCDEVYEPMNFVIDETSETMTVFDSESFIQNLSAKDRLEFSNICKEGSICSIIKIYRFISKLRPDGRRIGVCPGLVKHYGKTLGLPLNNERVLKNELNKFMIGRTSFLLTTDRPYIPGSAIKGSLRTAYLNHLAESARPQDSRKSQQLECELMQGSFNTDPFRLLKVSDFMPVGPVNSKVVYAVNEKKRRSQYEPKGPYQILEVIPPGAIFTGTITIEQPLEKAKIERPVDAKTLFQSIRKFFHTEKNLEDKILQSINIPQSPKVPEDALLLRVGRHSGAESMTIAGLRSIKIMKGRGQQSTYEKAATTLWLASPHDKGVQKQALQPFGWVELFKPSAEYETELANLEAQFTDSFMFSRPKEKDQSQRPKPTVEKKAPPTPTEDVWSGAVISWDPGRQQIIATLGTKKAYSAGRDLLPDSMVKSVIQKKKIAKANVTVNSSFKIVKIEPA